MLVDGGTHNPHDQAEKEEEYGKYGIVNGGFLGSMVTTFPISVKHEQTSEQRNTRHC